MSIKTHSTASEAYSQTTKSNVIAVKVTTHVGINEKHEFYSYKSKFDTPENLELDFPLPLSSNQSISEIDQFD